jgi:predicted hotdog family 3-hydroxylacyl-ACP dehydratase
MIQETVKEKIKFAPMKIPKANIESVLPHRSPFIMIDNLIDASTVEFKTDFIVQADNIFMKNDVLQEPALIENIAQTCAAGFGYLNSQSDGNATLGFIGAVSKLELFNLPKVNSKITTKANVTYQFQNVFLVKGENYCEDTKLLECEMKIVIT